MQRKSFIQFLSIMLSLVFFTSACQPGEAPESQGEDTQPVAVEATETSVPLTSTPMPTATVTLSPTPEPGIHVDEPFSPENVSQVTELWVSGNGNRVTDAWSDDSQYAGVATSIGAYLFDSVTGKEIFFKKHSRVKAIAFSHDSQLFAVGEKYQVIIYSLPAGEEIAKIDLSFTYEGTELAFILHQLAFHIETGNLVVYGEPDLLSPGLMVFNHYDPQTGKLVSHAQANSATGASNIISLLQIASDGRHLLKSPGYGDTAEIFDTNGILVSTGTFTGFGNYTGNFNAIAGDYIVTLIQPEEDVLVYDLSGSLLGRPQKPEPDEWGWGGAFLAQDGKSLYLYDRSTRNLYTYSLPDLELIGEIPFWGNNVRSISPDLTRSMNLVGWEINDAANEGEIIANLVIDITPKAMALNLTKPQLAIVGLNPTVSGGAIDNRIMLRLLDLTTLEESAITYSEEATQVQHMRFLQDGKTLITHFPFVSELDFFDVETEKSVGIFHVGIPAVTYKVSPDMNTLVVGQINPFGVEIWDLNTKEMLGEYKMTASATGVGSIEFSSDSQTVAVLGSSLLLWDMDVLDDPLIAGEYSAIAISSDFKKTATIGYNGSTAVVAIYDVETGELVGEFDKWQSPTERYNGLMIFTKDGDLLIISTTDGVVFMDVATGDILHRIDHEYLNDMQLSDDGSLLATFSTINATARLWGIP